MLTIRGHSLWVANQIKYRSLTDDYRSFWSGLKNYDGTRVGTIEEVWNCPSKSCSCNINWEGAC